MNDLCERTIQFLAARSSAAVTGVTILFALGGSCLVIYFGGSASLGLWIPLCFLVIPPVHYLSREVLQLRQHIVELERRLSIPTRIEQP